MTADQTRAEKEGTALAPLSEFKGRPRDKDRLTRKPLEFWDRIKLILLFVGSWVVMFWAALAQFDPQISNAEALRQTFRSYWWLLGLAGLEALRQLHYLVSEHSKRWHKAWTGMFATIAKRTGRMKAWTRYRLSRVMKVLFLLLILDLALAKIYHLPPATALIQLPILATKAMPFAFQLVFAFFFIAFQFLGLFWLLSKGGSEVFRPDEIETRFGDVKGQDRILDKVKESVLFLENPEAIEARGGKVPKGILLWGPPGTGKTLMAKAVAGETSKPFIFIEPAAFMNMFMGVGALKVKSLFRKARKLALRHGGVIMFFDEADSLGNRGIATGPGVLGRSTNALGWHRGCNGPAYMSPESQFVLLNDRMTPDPVAPKRDGIIAGFGGMGGGLGVLPSLLSELDGMEKPRGFINRHVRRLLGMKPRPPFKYRILTVMATNLPEALDPALLRPGRIERKYKVGYPSKQGRIDTYMKYLEEKKHVLTEEEIDKIATITPYYGGAQIEDLVNAALINAIEEGRDAIEWRDVVKAKQLNELGPPEDVEYIERERHAVAVHEACHAVVAYRVRQHLTIDIATIEKGGSYLGMVASIPPEDQFTHWRSEFEADIMSGIASLAGERMFFGGDSSSGVSADLADATGLATFMEGYWGMGSTVAVHGVTRTLGVGGGPGREDEKDSELLSHRLGARIEKNLQELLQRTEALLQNNRREVLAVAHALEAHKTLTGEDVVAIIEGNQGPLIDGRPYHTPEFLESAKSYHDEVVTAHKSHDKVTVPLPTFVGVPSGDGQGDGKESEAETSGNGELQVEGRSPNGPSRPPRPDKPVEVGEPQDQKEERR